MSISFRGAARTGLERSVWARDPPIDEPWMTPGQWAFKGVRPVGSVPTRSGFLRREGRI